MFRHYLRKEKIIISKTKGLNVNQENFCKTFTYSCTISERGLIKPPNWITLKVTRDWVDNSIVAILSEITMWSVFATKWHKN